MTGRVGETEIAAVMLSLVAEREGRNVEPTQVARALVGPHPDDWGPLMPLVRQVAVRLMKEGRLVVTRRGRPVDPDDFRGTYRIAAAPVSGPGSSAPLRPER